ncbi:MAG TPA: ABC transporter permease [Thermomicrobiales bacterium]|nr:ABC transporter permease [Thermomicrobiales bacterium]
MFLALRELRHARLRFAMIAAIMTLIAWLVFLLSGLANGLAADNAGAIQRLPADYLVFQADSRLLLQRSTLPPSAVAAVAAVPGVTAAAPLGQTMATVRRAAGGDQLDAAILAIDPASFLAPPIASGRPLQGAPANGVVVDRKLAEHGVVLGDTLLLQPSGRPLVVVGFTSGQAYSHAPVIYAPLARWPELRAAVPGAAGAGDTPINAVAVRADSAAAGRIAAAVPGVAVASRAEAVQQVPGYQEERGTLLMIQVFLVVIAAFIIAAFFYVLTMQKTAQFGVLKALGASTGFLARDLLGQVLLLTVGGIALGAALAFGVAGLLPGAIPFALAPHLVGLYGAALLAVALGGALLSLRRIATTDALSAIGRVE